MKETLITTWEDGLGDDLDGYFPRQELALVNKPESQEALVNLEGSWFLHPVLYPCLGLHSSLGYT